MVRSYLFSSPSSAASVLHGANCNGRTAWLDTRSEPSKEIRRAPRRPPAEFASQASKRVRPRRTCLRVRRRAHREPVTVRTPRVRARWAVRPTVTAAA
ncbi:DUF4357 domain-containing protein [Streptomyces sp. NBC_01210]|uniref:DUF4357 domain-containing protein n=1 Tax=Streptomyces sp. NBC_01210 TaxID=2903774 RepID=UPI003FA34C29